MGAMSHRVQNALVVGFAVLAAVAIFFAFSNVRGDGSGIRPAGVTPTTIPQTTTTGPATEGGTATDGADTDTGDDATTTVTAAPTTTAEPEPAEPVDALEHGRTVLADLDEPVVLAVLGDSTSNLVGQWVHAWGEQIAAQRPVSLSHWDEQSGRAYHVPWVFDSGTEAAPATIWSGSIAAATPATARALLPAIVPERPDLAVYNYGHSLQADEVEQQFTKLHDALESLYGPVPTVVVLQNPQVEDENAAVRQAIRDWAESNDHAVIDVAAEFEVAAWPLLIDRTQPSQQGQQVWLATMLAALGPDS